MYFMYCTRYSTVIVHGLYWELPTEHNHDLIKRRKEIWMRKASNWSVKFSFRVSLFFFFSFFVGSLSGWFPALPCTPFGRKHMNLWRLIPHINRSTTLKLCPFWRGGRNIGKLCCLLGLSQEVSGKARCIEDHFLDYEPHLLPGLFSSTYYFYFTYLLLCICNRVLMQ